MESGQFKPKNTLEADVPMFSVVIPNFNRSHSVRLSVQSALEQTISNIEVIVVDDGSQDDSVMRLRQISDTRLIVIEQRNSGASAARNRGVDEARGAFVAFLDSDDRYLLNHLEELYQLLRKENNVAAYSQVIVNRGGGKLMVKPPRAVRPNEQIATYLMCDRGFIQTSGLALRRSIAQKIRYREDVTFGDDVDFAVRLHLAGCRFLMTKAPSVVWADDARPDRLSVPVPRLHDRQWLDDLRPAIPPEAYYGYCGWHVAKTMWRRHKIQALKMYFSALFRRAYGPRLALLIFAQICVPPWIYRYTADILIGFRASRWRIANESLVFSDECEGKSGDKSL